MSWFTSAFTTTADIAIDLKSAQTSLLLPTEGGNARFSVFSSGNDVQGDVKFTIPANKKIDHAGIKAELKGVVETFGDKTQSYEFVSIPRVLSNPGTLPGGQTILAFNFSKARMPFESYEGINARCRYFIKVTISKSASSVLQTKEIDFIVQNPQAETEASQPEQVLATASDTLDSGKGVKLEVGIEDCLHIEFEYDRTRFHLEDVVTGRVFFHLVKIRIKHMELAVVRREATVNATSGSGGGQSEQETVSRFEVMDGCPVRGERVPIRLHLAGVATTPTYTSVANMFSVRYFLHLVLVDEEDRRYFKQQEITLWRKQVRGDDNIPFASHVEAAS